MDKKATDNKIVRKILLFILNIVSLVNKIIPKKRNYILLQDPSDHLFHDNTRALFEYLIENGYNKKYKIICSLTASTEYEELKAIENVILTSRNKGLLYFLISKYVFYSFGSVRVYPSKSQVVVQQWHGTPLKAIGNIKTDKLIGNEKIDHFTYLLAASDFIKPVMAKSFGCMEDRVAVLGHSRNDYLFGDKYTLDKLGHEKDQFAKTILWMPTFRVSKDKRYSDIGDKELNETMLPFLTTYESLEELNNHLKHKNILLVIKIHNFSSFQATNLSNIKTYSGLDLEEKNIQLYDFVKDFDVLLTDYSSIYFDFLLLNRPIGFTVDDFGEYEKNRGFSIEKPLEHMPGHHIYSMKELYEFLEDVVNEKDEYEDIRIQMNELFNKYKKDHSKRLLEFVGINKEMN